MRTQINKRARYKEDLDRIEREKQTLINREREKQKNDNWYMSNILTNGSVVQGTGTLAIVCLECGSEMYGLWDYPCFERRTGSFAPLWKLNSYKAVKMEIDSFMEMKKCPICGGKVWPFASKNIYDCYERGDISVSWSYGDKLDFQFGCLNKNIKLLDNSKVNSKVDSLIKKADAPVTISVNSKINDIKNSTEQLKSYILQLIHLEVNIYALTERLRVLYYRQIQTHRTLVFESSQPSPLEGKKVEIEAELSKVKANVSSAEADLHSAEEILSHAKAVLFEIETHPINIVYPQKPEEPQYETAGFFNKKRVLAENAEKKQRYEQALREYEWKLSECERQRIEYSPETKRKEVKKAEESVLKAKKRLSIVSDELKKANESYEKIIIELEKQEAEKGLVLTPTGVIHESIKKEIKEAQQLLNKTYLARNELYAYNIVFIKYRDIVALSTFYEYLMAGRCTSLEGANGAYNIYESEIRANTIISQLSTVIEKLEDIKQGQYMLYSELQTANASLSSLNDKMDSAVKALDKIETNTSQIAEDTELIAYNTAVTAYYSKKTAELTDALGFMLAFK